MCHYGEEAAHVKPQGFRVVPYGSSGLFFRVLFLSPLQTSVDVLVRTVINYSAKPTRSHIHCPRGCSARHGPAVPPRLSFPISCRSSGGHVVAKVKCLVNRRPLLRNLRPRLSPPLLLFINFAGVGHTALSPPSRVPRPIKEQVSDQQH